MKITGDLAKVFAAINKKMGDDTIVVGSEVIETGRMTTGSVAIDVALGGGWPTNQWHELIGEASNGKTALALKTIAANQKKDPDFTTVWVAAEQWVPGYATICGVDTSRVFVISSNIMEEAYEAVIKITESKQVDCIVIDSLPALVPTTEDEKEMEESTVGRAALLTNKFFRKVGKASKRSLVSDERPFIGLIINQWRSKIGVMYGDPRTTPGGKAKNFHYFTRVEVARDEWIKDKDEAIGQTIRGRTLKNKTYKPQQTAQVDFYFADGRGFHLGEFDTVKDVVNICVSVDIITRAGAFYSYGDRKWQGKEALVLGVREDLDLQAELREAATSFFLSA